ncbi:E3 ubiquitin-protein ligase RING2-like [Apodemus sylvaticus]|uniref:E3 ubiquitin-protein ligase RING2-like n=1 Tax=Apodemus sylvaticus TaxID=10129 RepID=UPI00224391E0|nr:E3 ubiquitin-protein ligase RING2-like [Apodemus sylvaticus]
MSHAIKISEMRPESETSEQSSQKLQETSQETTATDLENVILQRDEWKDFKCPICLDTLKNTWITKNCSHRFCKDCIVTALRRGKKECPICRRKVISKRSLDPDPQFDALISKIYPDYNKKEVSEENALVRRKYKTQQALHLSSEKGEERDEQREDEQIETNIGWESNCSTSPCCSNISIDEAGPSKKRVKTTLGLNHDTKGTIVTINAAHNGAN